MERDVEIATKALKVMALTEASKEENPRKSLMDAALDFCEQVGRNAAEIYLLTILTSEQCWNDTQAWAEMIGVTWRGGRLESEEVPVSLSAEEELMALGDF